MAMMVWWFPSGPTAQVCRLGPKVSSAVWRCSAFIAWTGWTLAMTVSHDDIVWYSHYYYKPIIGLTLSVTQLRKIG